MNDSDNSWSPAKPCTMVILGAKSDLTRRKLIPAICNLKEAGLLSERFALVAFGRDLNDQGVQEKMKQEVGQYLPDKLQPGIWEWVEERLYYSSGEFRDPKAYRKLRDLLGKIEKKHSTDGNCVFYLATPPSFFGEIPRQLDRAGLAREKGNFWRRVIVEKPFGRDLKSAQTLNRELLEVLDEGQIYRIDHYLGKETVQNILVFRFANSIFEPIWNRRYVDHVQITVAETVGVGSRGGYYEEAGALRDMIPNHLFQLMALIAMEPPISFEAEAVRNEKGKIFHAIKPIDPDEVLNVAVRGQYSEGVIPQEEKVPGYRSEPAVPADATTETYAALKLMIDNWRWADVPFYLRTGKRLPAHATEICIQFKKSPFIMFRKTPVEHLEPNHLVLRIQPNEGIALSFSAKIPGPVVRIGDVSMDFCNAEYFESRPATGYETLLYDCMNGDPSLFQRGDNTEAAWSVVTPILDVWQALPPRNFPNYVAGTWGPQEGSELLQRDSRRWAKMK